MGAFDKFKNAKASRGPIRRAELGNYRCRIDSVKFDKTRKGIEMFTVGFSIVALLDPESKLKVNDTIDYAAMSDWDNYDSLVKEIIVKSLDSTEEELNAMDEKSFDELMEGATGAAQQLSGRLMDVECIPWENKKGEDTTVTRFRAVPEAEQAAAA